MTCESMQCPERNVHRQLHAIGSTVTTDQLDPIVKFPRSVTRQRNRKTAVRLKANSIASVLLHLAIKERQG